MSSRDEYGNWAVLQFDKRSQKKPHIFYTFHWNMEGVQLDVTDLLNLWTCHVRRQTLVQKARDQETSIDPSESNTQFETFCSKLGESILNGQNNLQVNDWEDVERGVSSVVLTTTMELPKPLKPLSWSFQLEPQEPARFAKVITLAALEGLSQKETEMEQLFQAIKEKDHVISKLLDKIEGSAIDLGLLFPGITGMKSRRAHVTVAEASKHVPGMAAFERSHWIEKHRNKDGVDKPAAISSLSKTLSGFSSGRKDDDLADSGLLGYLRRKENSRGQSQGNNSLVNQSQKSTQGKGSEENESAFETQPTPPNLQTRRPPSDQEMADDSSTESDLDHPLPPKGVTKSTNPLGRIGPGRKGQKSPNSSSDTDPEIPTTTNTTSPPRQAALSSSSKLGRIGGGSHQRKKTLSRSPSRSPQAPSTPRRLGVISKKFSSSPPMRSSPAKTAAVAAAEKVEERDSDVTASSKSSEEDERETEEQARARRREELKRSVKGDDGRKNTKKKRRF